MSLYRSFLLLTHLTALAVGFALGVYFLPILTAAEAPAAAKIAEVAARQRFTGAFRRNLADSDFLHWGEGSVHVATDSIAHEGALAPGPNYKLYLSPEFVETEAEFKRLRPRMVEVGDIRSFNGFMLPVPAGVDVGKFSTVVVWCEAFSQFITAAKYQDTPAL